MRLVDLYYKIISNYRKEMDGNREAENEIRTIRAADNKTDRLESIKYKCNISEDWITNIEEGLEYVDKAIKEERQFIAQQGEVVRIEKAKKASKATVSHLARHSNLITHVPEEEGATLVPDKVYIVEKLADYAVYENRFIYMLLCYLRDFINLRFEKIEDKLTTYNASLYIKKDIYLGRRTVNCEIKLDDEIKHDPFLYEKYRQLSLVERIDAAYQTVLSLLNTPLMIEVGKSPMIKPPIISTNVLKMNPNFKAALALYNYISSYKGDGYSFEEVHEVYTPFDKEMGSDYASLIALTTFTTYKYGNDLKDNLQVAYEEENKKQKELEKQKFIEQLIKLKRRVTESQSDLEKYSIMLEQRIRMLENEIYELNKLKQINEELTFELEKVKEQKKELSEKVDGLNKTIQEQMSEINRLNEKYINDMKASEEAHRREIDNMYIRHQQEINNLKTQHEQEIQNLHSQYQSQIELIQERYQSEINELNEKYQNEINNLTERYENEINYLKDRYETELNETVDKYRDQINVLIESQREEKNKMINEYVSQINDLTEGIKAAKEEREKIMDSYKARIELLDIEKQRITDEFDVRYKQFERERTEFLQEEERKIRENDEEVQRIREDKDVILACFNSLRNEHGLITVDNDFTTKMKFEELEAQYNAFKKLFKNEWKKTKRKIRSNILSNVDVDDKKNTNN